MIVSRKRAQRLEAMLDLFDRDEDWLIVINADPDAMAAAMALKRIMARRAGEVAISHINAISRPDNLAMIRYLRIPLIPYDDTLPAFFHRFAMVDSQPHHSPSFAGIPFSLIIDHHPLVAEHPCVSSPGKLYCDIRPGMSTTSTIMAEYLHNMGLRPGARLATALQYGIRTDTASFTRNTGEADLRAYNVLAKSADPLLLHRILRSEYLPSWLKYFSRAFSSLHQCGGGRFAFAGEVESPDILVVVADFFTRVHGLRWVAVGGVYGKTVVIIFRGDGLSTDLGAFAEKHFGSLGSAGGHRAMARAEFPLEMAEGRNLEAFVFKKMGDGGRSALPPVPAVAPAASAVPPAPAPLAMSSTPALSPELARGTPSVG